VCGIRLPAGLRQCSRLPEPIFTPATKEESGHDQNISYDEMVLQVGAEVAGELRRRTLEVYSRALEHALACGLIIADTKLEWGWVGASGGGRDELILIDEVLTPDSSRFWPANQYQPGRAQVSFDKQYLREYLETTGWDKSSPPPGLPDAVVTRTREKYIEAYERLTGQAFAAS
jgi:phosphoribosylaminoimidazole-succinocarboxamide synthase